MRRLAIRLLAIALLGAAFSQLHAGTAEACIRLDREAEIRAVTRAIRSLKTPTAVRKELRDLHRGMMAHRDEDAVKALKLIGKDRIMKPPVTRAALPKGAVATGCG